MLNFILLPIGLYLLVELVLWVSLFFFKPRVLEVPHLHLKGAQGLALPSLILLTSGVFHSEAVLRHELCHLQQMKRYSVGGTCLVLLYHYVRLAFQFKRQHGRFPRHLFELWHLNPIEIEANNAMELDTPLPPVARIPLNDPRNPFNRFKKKRTAITRFILSAGHKTLR